MAVLFKIKRFIYFVKLTYKNKIYYKIGLNSHKDIHRRFRKGMLKNAGIKLEVLNHVELPNIIACLTEYYVLTKFKDKRKYFKELNVFKIDGATECFSENILDSYDMLDLINMSICKFEEILKQFNLTEQEKNSALLKFHDSKNF